MKDVTPSEFAKSWHEHNKITELLNCFRDPDCQKEIPISLLDSNFGFFAQNFDKFDVTKEDEANAFELVNSMCKYYGSELERTEMFKEVAKKFLAGFTFHQEERFKKYLF